MILFHGTNIDFDKILLSKSHLAKDFGVGFYLTPDKHVAKRQADRKIIQCGEGSSIVIAYNWDEKKSSELKILRFDSYTIEWAKFIYLNRNNKSRNQIHDYDIVIGPIADDTVGLQIRRYDDGIINMQQLVEEIKFHYKTMQYFFATEKALSTLHRL